MDLQLLQVRWVLGAVSGVGGRRGVLTAVLYLSRSLADVERNLGRNQANLARQIQLDGRHPRRAEHFEGVVFLCPDVTSVYAQNPRPEEL